MLFRSESALALDRTNAALAAETLLPGRWSLVSQSGSVMGTLLSRAAARGFGFAKIIGDVRDGAMGVLALFGVSVLVTALLVWNYAGRWKLALAPVLCSLVAVIWQLGALTALGFGIDPFSILVPFLVFAIGIIGTGLLAVPVLAGSAAYALGEARKWPVGFSRKWQEAKAFYGTVALATLVGMILNFTEIDPIQALYWSAVINCVAAVPVLVAMMMIGRRQDILGAFTIGPALTLLGWLSVGVMGLTILGMIFIPG